MKRQIFNYCITALAVLGIFVILGGVGTMDYMVEIGKNYPLSNTIRTIAIGVLMLLPAVVREVI